MGAGSGARLPFAPSGRVPGLRSRDRIGRRPAASAAQPVEPSSRARYTRPADAAPSSGPAIQTMMFAVERARRRGPAPATGPG